MNKKIKTVMFVSAMIMLIGTLFTAYADDKQTIVPYENIGIGGGGAFFNPLIDPTDSNVYYVTSDMGALYYSHDKAVTWNRTESRGALDKTCISDDGTLFAGGYGLYASFDKGETLKLIYPQNVQFSVSRCGWNEYLMMAQDYDNGYLKCIDTDETKVYFATVDWEGALRILKCDYNGNNLETLYTATLNISDPVSGINIYMCVQENGLYFTLGNVLNYYNFADKSVSKIYEAAGKLKDFKKIGNYFFILDDKQAATSILYTTDFENYCELSDLNILSSTYTNWKGAHTFDWHFKQICGNSFDSIFLSFSSKLNDTGESVDGIIKFNGEGFEWVFDSMYKTRNTLSKKDWSYGCYGPFFGIACDAQNDNICLVANIETVYVLNYGSESDREVYSTHCITSADSTYTTTGLNVQTTYSVNEDPFNANHIIICTTDLGLQNSYNGGKTWSRMKITESAYQIYNTCYDLYFDQNTRDVVYGLWSSRHDAPYSPSLNDRDTTMGRFAVSYDGGSTWDFDYSSGLPADCIPVKMSTVKKADGFTVAVATFNRGFYISYNSGRTFTCISSTLPTYGDLVFGEDVVLTSNAVYCLTAPYNQSGTWTPGELYEYMLSSGEINKIDLGEVIMPRSLTYSKDKGLYINAIPSYHFQWMPEYGNGIFVNDHGGVYHYDGKTVSCIFKNDTGVFNSGFDSNGIMYAVDTYGKVFVCQEGQFRLYVDGLFNMLKNVSFSSDGKKMYITSLGGGVYRMPTLEIQSQEPETTTELITEPATQKPTQPNSDKTGGFFAWLMSIIRTVLSWFKIKI